jgi:hypothetical protein
MMKKLNNAPNKVLMLVSHPKLNIQKLFQRLKPNILKVIQEKLQKFKRLTKP